MSTSSTPLPIYAKLALVTSGTVAVMALAGSSVSLYRIGCDAVMALPLALPVALDLPAVVAATAIHARRRDWLAWLTLVAATTVSTVLQVIDAWDHGGMARVAHGAPPVAALLCFELAMRALRPTGAPATRRRPASSTPETVGAGRDTLPAPPPATPSTPEPRPALAVVGRKSEDEIVAEVDAWLAGQDRAPSKASVKDAGAALGLPCRGNDRALAVAAAVRDRRMKAS